MECKPLSDRSRICFVHTYSCDIRTVFGLTRLKSWMCFVIVIVLFFIFNNLRALFVGEMGKPLPGPKSLPLVGNSFDVDIQTYHHSFPKMA